MSAEFEVTGRVVAAARALAGVSQSDFAEAAGFTRSRLRRAEGAGSAWVTDRGTCEGLRRAFDHFGLVAIGDGEGMGGGVRLRFTRQDVRQLARLEGEGGAVGSDNAA